MKFNRKLIQYVAYVLGFVNLRMLSGPVFEAHWLLTRQTRSSADADNRLDAFSGQSRSTNMVPFHM